MPEDVPDVIRDAITVTTELLYRYLWVDRYYIPQHNCEESDYEEKKCKEEKWKVEERNRQLQHIDSIYSKAQATIMTVAGKDSTYSLPGVEPTFRPRQPTVQVYKEMFVLTLSDLK